MLGYWRQSLRSFLDWFEKRQSQSGCFLVKLFVFFAGLNFACYWWALFTAYPQHLASHKAIEYQLMGFPVALMGSIFDSFSLFVTILMVRRALKTDRTGVYLAYLSVDLFIAILATFWVLFAFVASGWLVNIVLDNPETFNQRTALYEGRVWNAIFNPFAENNIKNVYFGVLMGASALLPTLLHISMASAAAFKWGLGRFAYSKAG
ncbi:hypothetical protein RYZ26_06760 [Terasakiella sp. A23]|uniref:hypothetical protein n=1 Tax=Terasakiella sp. FCG-A23 TaxID=3080561 RepID=UPI0029547328|nr:hypothetical protein [Terasakiella sp. A23]MDV7339287.1 hypothetical protein [Terasakiella sp. A23]